MANQDPIGTSIGNYRITSRIGEGGMGSVYVAEHPKLTRRVAVKVLTKALQDDDGAERFESEARVMATLRHPHIAEVYDFGTLDNGQLFYIMEYLPGPSLRQMLDRAPFSAAEAARYLAQICEALDAAHQAGIVHRDLKPANILATDADASVLKVVDFGIAKLAERPQDRERTQEGVIIGSPRVMSPEQAAGRTSEITAKTDIYAVGVIAYWMLSGVPPFDDKEVPVLLYKQISAPPQPLSERQPALPGEVAAAVHQCLEKNPKQRPASAGSFATAFSAALGSAPATDTADAPAQPLLPTATKPIQRKPRPERRPSEELAATVVAKPSKASVSATDATQIEAQAVTESGAQPDHNGARNRLLVVALIVLAGGVIWFATRTPQQKPATVIVPPSPSTRSTSAPGTQDAQPQQPDASRKPDSAAPSADAATPVPVPTKVAKKRPRKPGKRRPRLKTKRVQPATKTPSKTKRPALPPDTEAPVEPE